MVILLISGIEERLIIAHAHQQANVLLAPKTILSDLNTN